MKKILIGIVGVLGVAIVGILGAAAMQPDQMHVERSATYTATPADVFPLINDIQQGHNWSPWAELDPDQKTVFSDPTTGVGAWYTWEGNDQVGKGRLEIIESVPNEKVVEKLEFIEPFASTATVSLALQPEGESVKVTWAMDQDLDMMSKVMCLFMDMDAMLGKDFEKGLGNLKGLAETAAQERIAAEQKAAEEAAKAAELAAADPTAAAEGTPAIQ